MWHFHEWGTRGYCAERRLLVIGRPGGEGQCTVGTHVTRSGEMLHVWFIDHPLGPYADAMVFPDAAAGLGVTHLHPIAVHFTIALIVVAVLLDVLGRLLRRPALHTAASVNLLISAVAGVVTIGAGMAAEVKLLISHDVHAVLDTHKLLGFAGFGGILVLALWRAAARGRFPARAGWLHLAVGVLTAGVASGRDTWGRNWCTTTAWRCRPSTGRRWSATSGRSMAARRPWRRPPIPSTCIMASRPGPAPAPLLALAALAAWTALGASECGTRASDATAGAAPAGTAGADAGAVSGAPQADVSAESGLPVFPGAEGYGTRTRAGRGGKVVAVTSLADSGPGTLRDALEDRGPRTIVFRVGGVIELKSHLFIRHPFVTVAGQTAPGDGIVLKDFGLVISTNDVLVQSLRVRPGNRGDVRPDHNDAIAILGRNGDATGARNVVLDHLSVSWGEDELVSTWFAPADITVSWSIMSEALNRSRHDKGTHSAGLLVGDRSNRVSVHHNLLAHNDFRNPLVISGGTHDVVNNVVYDWGRSRPSWWTTRRRRST